EVRGRARGTWFFEGDFPLVLLDGRGNLVAQGFATAKGEWMTTEFVPFSAVLRFQSPEPGPGRLILKKDNPSDRRELDDALVVPVVFK
ncbi:MAG: Gmad2 immunoglobulin-like domain-containing protein, partial [Thiogranum sp.]